MMKPYTLVLSAEQQAEEDRCLKNWLACRLVRGSDGKGSLILSHRAERRIVKRLFRYALKRGLQIVPGWYYPRGGGDPVKLPA